MRAILKKVGQAPTIVDDETLSLKFLQKAVGGYIEMVAIGPDVSVVCNEDGISLGLPQNCCGLLGDIVIMATDADTGEPRDLTDEEVRKGLAWLEKFAPITHPGDGRVVIVSGEEARSHLLEQRSDIAKTWAQL